METTYTVALPADEDLLATLGALAIPYRLGTQGNAEVDMDVDIDGRLEHLIGRLSDMRWGYQPGRTIQIEIPGLEGC